ncbi:MAG: SGNH/GDSL hydrolase family protein [Actinomycetaceae bacterium]|nr:SGNH/GDSL hydrolase family protein [Actinomycetaceae bacterium]
MISNPTDRLRHWDTYVAIGDSTTEGLWDVRADGSLGGWADRLAAKLSARRAVIAMPPLNYANLAVRGRTMEPILREQLPHAVSLGADLISITAGGNDIVRPRVNVNRLARQMEEAVRQLRQHNIDVLLVTSSDPSGSPLIELTRSRVSAFNASLWSIAQRYECGVVDQWGLKPLQTWNAWADDRFHLTARGHEIVANAALVGLGLAPDDPHYADVPDEWRRALAGPPPSHWRWIKEHVAPWVARHARGLSSGTGRVAKRPVPTPTNSP